MAGKAEILKEEFTFAFEALENSLEGLDEEEFTYRLTEASNRIQGILTHLNIITNLNIPSIIQGQYYWTPEDKVIDPDDPEYSLQKLVGVIKKGKEKIL